jgi:hypothetical protein
VFLEVQVPVLQTLLHEPKRAEERQAPSLASLTIGTAPLSPLHDTSQPQYHEDGGDMGSRPSRHAVVEVWQRIHVEEHGLPQAKDQVRHLPMRHDTVCGERELRHRCAIRYIPRTH